MFFLAEIKSKIVRQHVKKVHGLSKILNVYCDSSHCFWLRSLHKGRALHEIITDLPSKLLPVCIVVADDPGNPFGVEGIAHDHQRELVFLEAWGRRDAHDEYLIHNNIFCTLWDLMRLYLKVVVTSCACYSVHAVLMFAALILGLELLLAYIADGPK